MFTPELTRIFVKSCLLRFIFIAGTRITYSSINIMVLLKFLGVRCSVYRFLSDFMDVFEFVLCLIYFLLSNFEIN